MTCGFKEIFLAGSAVSHSSEGASFLERQKAICLLAMTVICLSASAVRIKAQVAPRSHEECMKLVPGDWGPNFGEQWHEHEAVYWGCRLGVPAQTVTEWQQVADVEGMIQDLIPKAIRKKDLVLIEEMEGSAHCYQFIALEKTAGGWKQIWSAPAADSMDYCTLTCPPIKMRFRRNDLILEIPYTSNPKEDATFSCKSLKWESEIYHWDGHTFKPTKVRTRMIPVSAAAANRQR
jgi:hypothetical protein